MLPGLLFQALTPSPFPSHFSKHLSHLHFHPALPSSYPISASIPFFQALFPSPLPSMTSPSIPFLAGTPQAVVAALCSSSIPRPLLAVSEQPLHIFPSPSPSPVSHPGCGSVPSWPLNSPVTPQQGWDCGVDFGEDKGRQIPGDAPGMHLLGE